MKISSINTHNPSFGQIRRCAALKAIQETNGNINKLNIIRDLVDREKNNDKYDVIWSDTDDYYEVIKKGTDRISAYCGTISDACFYANEWYRRDNGINAYGPQADGIIDEILAGCSD